MGVGLLGCGSNWSPSGARVELRPQSACVYHSCVAVSLMGPSMGQWVWFHLPLQTQLACHPMGRVVNELGSHGTRALPLTVEYIPNLPKRAGEPPTHPSHPK